MQIFWAWFAPGADKEFPLGASSPENAPDTLSL